MQLFVRGLNSIETMRYVALEEPATIDEAIQLASGFEAYGESPESGRNRKPKPDTFANVNTRPFHPAPVAPILPAQMQAPAAPMPPPMPMGTAPPDAQNNQVLCHMANCLDDLGKRMARMETKPRTRKAEMECTILYNNVQYCARKINMADTTNFECRSLLVHCCTCCL